MKNLLTIREAGAPGEANRHPNWFRAGIRHGKITALKVGNTFVLTREEVDRLKQNPPTLSRKEMEDYGVAKS